MLPSCIAIAPHVRRVRPVSNPEGIADRQFGEGEIIFFCRTFTKFLGLGIDWPTRH